MRALLFLIFLGIVYSWSPSGTYAPGIVSCPIKESLVREASELSPEEKQWLEIRGTQSQASLKDFLRYSTSLDPSEYEGLVTSNGSVDDHVKLGLTFSGGGFRAMLCGAGQLAAVDNLTKGAFENGLGGLLQASTYLAGLSGGNWLIGSLALNNWTNVEAISHSKDLWQIQRPLYESGTKKHHWRLTYRNWKQWIFDLKMKIKAGFRVTVVDVWGRALTSRFINADFQAREAETWSDIRKVPAFLTGQMPFPISVSQGKPNAYTINYENSTIFESTPFEFGSWDPSVRSFTDIKYLGSSYVNGVPVDSKVCIAGFDSAGFIMGASSNIWDMGFDSLVVALTKNPLYVLFRKLLEKLGSKYSTDAVISPNPFYKTTHGTHKEFQDVNTFALVDGGQDNQNVPIIPLAMPGRKVDAMIIFDNSADTAQNYPNASSLIYTYNRQFSKIGQTYSVPYMPPTEFIVENKLNERPIFFGCDAKNSSGLNYVPPLMIYSPNRHLSYASNFSTMKMAFTDSSKFGIIQNGFENASRNNMTEDAQYRTCVGCALIRRKQERLNITQSDQCKQCFDRYCWDGKY